MVPSRSDVGSRFDVDLSTPDGIGTTIPLVVANMTAVAGRRMAETVARRGGIAVLPQDIPIDVIEYVVAWVKSRHPMYETAITLSPHHTVGDALSLIHKRAHGAVIVVDDERPVGVFTEHDAVGFDRFTQLQHVMSTELDTLPADVTAERAFERLQRRAPDAGAGCRPRRSSARPDDEHRRAAIDDLPPGGRRRGSAARVGGGRRQRRPGRPRRGARRSSASTCS